MTDAGFDPGALYAGCRARITEVLAGLDDDTTRAPVPACPAWSVHDVVAHLGGAVDDILVGNTEGVATDAWTAAQVRDRVGVPTADLLDRWNERAPLVEDGVAAAPRRLQHMFVADVCTHEHDIRGALGRHGAQDSAAVAASVAWLLTGFDQVLRDEGLPPLAVQVGGRAQVCGEGEPAGTLTVSSFELFRARMGRRSVAQIRRMDWSVEPKPYLERFAVFDPPVDDLAY